jgi:diguanylate cyclase (GGDEF)-like protein
MTNVLKIILEFLKPPSPPKEQILDKSALEFEYDARQFLKFHGFKLKFPEKMEKLFQDFEIQLRLRRYYILGFIAVITYNLFCINDYRIIPTMYKTAWFIRLCVVSPLLLLTLFIGKFDRFRPHIDYFATVFIFIVSISVIVIYEYINRPIMYTSYITGISTITGIMIIVVFGNIVVRIRFWYAIAISLSIQLIYSVFSIFILPIPIATWINGSISLFVIIIISLIGNYQLEKELRRSFLFTLLLSIDSIKLEESNLILTRLSVLDFLTGLANRRLFDETIDREWRVGIRKKNPISIIFLDIDFFKLYNDNYGHQAGDECLRQIAEVLKKYSRRPHDLCARYGGEEFIILLPEVRISEAAEIAEKIRTDVYKLQIKHDFSDTASHVTVSIGVADIIPTLKYNYNYLVDLADNALYSAKLGGRNRITVSQKDENTPN